MFRKELNILDEWMVTLMKENDKVRIKKNNIIGVIIDIYEVDDTKYFSVESIEKGVTTEDGYGGDFPIFDCVADEIEPITPIR